MEAVARVGGVVAWHAHSYRRLWFGTLTTSFLNPIFFLVSVGVLLGTLVDRSNPDLGGLSYLEFVAPALVATTAMQTAASVTTFPMKAGLKWLRTYHAVIATPVRVSELVTGVLAWAGIRILVATTVFVLVAAVAGAFTSPLAMLAPVAALLCGLVILLGPGLVWLALLRAEDRRGRSGDEAACFVPAVWGTSSGVSCPSVIVND